MAVTRQPNAVKMTAAADQTTEKLRVYQLIWSGMTAATDVLTIQDVAGNELLSVVATTVSPFQIFEPFGELKTCVGGVKIATMTSGQVELILR